MKIPEIKYIDENKRDTTELVVLPNDVPVIKFPALSEFDFIKHGFSTRLGGVSTGIYESMNLTYTRADDTAKVDENFAIIAKALDTKPENMVYAMQTHTTNVRVVTRDMCGMGVIRDRDFADIDGLITNEPGLCLVTSYADCVPLYFVDPVRKCIGLSHSGWRGTVGKIAINTVKMMTETYGSNPADIVTVIGPSICQSCYEVSEDVASIFKEAYNVCEVENILKEKPNGKYLLNLHKANVYNMLEAGIQEGNIHVTDICTCCNPALLYSHRASNGQRGGLCGFLEIN